MKKIISLAALTLGFWSFTAKATVAPVVVACYIPTASISMQFDQDQTTMTVAYQVNGATNNPPALLEHPDSDFAKQFSYVTIQWNSLQDGVFTGHFVSGNQAFPIIDTTVQLEVLGDGHGGHTLKSAQFYHQGTTYDLHDFVGKSCYVQ